MSRLVATYRADRQQLLRCSLFGWCLARPEHCASTLIQCRASGTRDRLDVRSQRCVCVSVAHDRLVIFEGAKCLQVGSARAPCAPKTHNTCRDFQSLRDRVDFTYEKLVRFEGARRLVFSVDAVPVPRKHEGCQVKYRDIPHARLRCTSGSRPGLVQGGGSLLF